MIYINSSEPIPLSPGKSLLNLAHENNIEINYSCGGNGTCGTCRVIIENHKDLPARNNIEQEMANDRGFSAQERLACQTNCDRPLRLKTPKSQ